jgi:hypothetical protein
VERGLGLFDAREHNEMQLELFTEYQQGTDAQCQKHPSIIVQLPLSLVQTKPKEAESNFLFPAEALGIAPTASHCAHEHAQRVSYHPVPSSSPKPLSTDILDDHDYDHASSNPNTV